MLWFNRFKVMNRLVFGVSGRVVLFAFCFGLCVSPSVALGSVNLQLANLKQDMELVSRELAGLRTEVELLRRENAQLRVFRRATFPPPKLSIRNEPKSYPTSGYPFAGVGEACLAGRKRTDRPPKKISTNNSRISLPRRTRRFPKSVNPRPLHPVLPPRLFLGLPSNGIRTQSRKRRNGQQCCPEVQVENQMDHRCQPNC